MDGVALRADVASSLANVILKYKGRLLVQREL